MTYVPLFRRICVVHFYTYKMHIFLAFCDIGIKKNINNSIK